jgi:hypothetical protein
MTQTETETRQVNQHEVAAFLRREAEATGSALSKVIQQYSRTSGISPNTLDKWVHPEKMKRKAEKARSLKGERKDKVGDMSEAGESHGLPREDEDDSSSGALQIGTVNDKEVTMASHKGIVNALENSVDFHEVCLAFPLMDDDAFREFCEDIKANGLRNEIVTYQGKIIDGRNRYNACLAVGVEPITREWDGKGSLVAYVVSMNLRRRHLDASQRANLAAKLMPQFQGEAAKRKAQASGQPRGTKQSLMEKIPGETNEGAARDQAARAVGVNPRYVDAAVKIRNEAPELAAKVEKGEITIPQAKKVLKGATIEEAKKRKPREKKTPSVQPKLEGQGEARADLEKVESEQSPWQKILSQLRRLKEAIDSAPEPTDEECEKVLSILYEKTGNIERLKCPFYRVFKPMQATTCEDYLHSNPPTEPESTQASSTEINPTDTKKRQLEPAPATEKEYIVCGRNGGDKMKASHCGDSCRDSKECPDYLQWTTAAAQAKQLVA